MHEAAAERKKIKTDKGLANRLEKVEQDQPLPTYQRFEIDNSDRDNKNEEVDPNQIEEEKGMSSAFMSPIT